MAPAPASVLAINGGSSSIKFAVYRAGTVPTLSLSGMLDRIGRSGTTLSWRAKEGAPFKGHAQMPDEMPAPRLLIDWLEAWEQFADVRAVGHRVVHGMAHTEPERITPDVLDELRRATPYAPDHLPREIELIEAFRERHPHLPQVACFDTAFHGTMPRVATLLPIPRR
jgi:acetate kinase